MQPSEQFQAAVDHMQQQLRCTGIPVDQWVAIIAAQTQQACVADSPLLPRQAYPQENDVVKAFDTSVIESKILTLMADPNPDNLSLVDLGVLKSAGLQTQALLELQRYYGRRKQPRMVRIVNAAHRRATLSRPTGPLNSQLRAAVENHLAQVK